VAVIGELPGVRIPRVRRTRDQCCWGQSPETPRVLGPSNRRSRGSMIEASGKTPKGLYQISAYQDSEF
jgi:hypothetical protein